MVFKPSTFQKQFCSFKFDTKLVNVLKHFITTDKVVSMENTVWNTDGVKEARNSSGSKVQVYLHQSKIEEGCEGPGQETKAHLAVGCWQPGGKEWKPLGRKGEGQRGRERQIQDVKGHGEKVLK